MKLVNLTPHAIVLRSAPVTCCDGWQGMDCVLCGGQGIYCPPDTTIPPSGVIARVSTTPGKPEVVEGVPVPVYSPSRFGSVTGLPSDHSDNTLYIVSGIVLSAASSLLNDLAGPKLVAPGTGPNDGAIRNDKGQIVAVTRLIRG